MVTRRPSNIPTTATPTIAVFLKYRMTCVRYIATHETIPRLHAY